MQYVGKTSDGIECVLRATAVYCVLQLNDEGVSDEYRGKKVELVYDGTDFWEAGTNIMLHGRDTICALHEFRRIGLMKEYLS